MMFRPMRRGKQALDEAACVRLLETAPRGVLSVHGEDGYPYGLPMNFVYAEGKLYFHCAKEGHKLDALRADDRASFCALSDAQPEPDAWWYHFQSVILFGRVRRLQDPAEVERAARLLGGKYFPTQELLEEELAGALDRVCMLELTVEHMTGKRIKEK